MDQQSLEMLEASLRKTMLSTSGADLDAALNELGWADMLSDAPELSIPLVFRLLGETGSHASILNDIVVIQTVGRELGQIPELPYAGNGWVVWDYTSGENTTLGGLPLRRVDEGDPVRLVDARRAVAWWLIGASRAMLALARQHALTACSSGARSRGSRLSGTGSPRRWWPSRAPRRRWTCPARTIPT